MNENNNQNMQQFNEDMIQQPNITQQPNVMQQQNVISSEPIKEPNNNKNKKTIIIIGLILIIGLCVAGYFFINKDKDSSSNADNNKNKTNNTVDNNTQTIENYTTYKTKITRNGKDSDLTLEIVNGILKITITDETIETKGIIGKVKAFTLIWGPVGETDLLVITEDNRLFTTYYESNDFWNDTLVFTEIKLNLEVSNVTTLWGGSIHSLAVVLKNGEIRALDWDWNGDEKEYEVGTFDYSVFNIDYLNHKSDYSGIVLYNDRTIGSFDDNKKIEYNNEKIIVDKIITTTKLEKFEYYVISNNKLYQIYFTNDNVYNLRKFSQIKQVNDNKIVKESLTITKNHNVYLDETAQNGTATDIITFDDGATYTINNINYVYNAK